MKKIGKLAALLTGAVLLFAAASYGAAGEVANVTVGDGTVTVSGLREALPNVTGLPNNGVKSYNRILQYTVNGGTLMTAPVTDGLKGTGTWSFTQTFPDVTAPTKPAGSASISNGNYKINFSSNEPAKTSRSISYQVEEAETHNWKTWPCTHSENSLHTYDAGGYYGGDVYKDIRNHIWWGDLAYIDWPESSSTGEIVRDYFFNFCGECKSAAMFDLQRGTYRCFGSSRNNQNTSFIWSKTVSVPDKVSGLKGYWSQITTSSTPPSPAQIKANGTFSASSELTQPVTKTTKYAHIIAEDNAGNLSASLTVALPGCTCEIGKISLASPQNVQLEANETEVPLSFSAAKNGSCTVPGHDATPVQLAYSLKSGSANGSLTGNLLKVQKSGSFTIQVDASLNLAGAKSQNFTIQVDKCTCDDISVSCSTATLYLERSIADVSHTLSPIADSTCDIAAHNSIPTSFTYALTGNKDGGALSANVFTATKPGVFPVTITAEHNGFTAQTVPDITVVGCSCTVDILDYPDFSIDLAHDETEVQLAATVDGSTSCQIPSHSGNVPTVTYSLSTPMEGASVTGTTLTVPKSGVYPVKTTTSFNGNEKEIITNVTVWKCTCDDISVSCSPATLYLERSMADVSHTFAPTANSTCDIAAHNSIPTSFSYTLAGNRDGGALSTNVFTATKPGVFPVTITAEHNGFTAQTVPDITVVGCSCTVDTLDYPDFSIDLAHDETEVQLAATVDGSTSCQIPSHSGNVPTVTYSLTTPMEGASVAGTTLTVSQSGVYPVKTTASFNGNEKEIITNVTVWKCTCDDISVSCSPATLYLERSMANVSHTLSPISDSTCDITAHNSIPTSFTYALTGNKEGGALSANVFTATKPGVFPVTITAEHNGFTAQTVPDITVVGCSCTVDTLNYPDFSIDLAHDETEVQLAATVVGSTSCQIPTHAGNVPMITYSLSSQIEGASVTGTTLTVPKSGLYEVKTKTVFNGEEKEITTKITVRKCICNTVEINFPHILAALDDVTGIATVDFTATAKKEILCEHTGHTNKSPESVSYLLTGNPGDGSITGSRFSATVPGLYTVEVTLTLNGVPNVKAGTVQVVECGCTFTPIEFEDFTIEIPAETGTESRVLSANARSLNTCTIPSHMDKEPEFSYQLMGTPSAALTGNLLKVVQDESVSIRATATLGKNSGSKDITVTAKLLPLPPVFDPSAIPNDWTEQPVTCTLNAPNGGTILYSINERTPQTYTTPIQLQEDGIFKLTTWVEKHGKTTETVTLPTIKIDQSAPKVPILSGISESGWYNPPDLVTAAIDPTTGSKETLLFQLDSGDWTETPPAPEADGVYPVACKVLDELNRESPIATYELKLDRKPPEIIGVSNGGIYYVDRVLEAHDENFAAILTEEQPNEEIAPVRLQMRTIPPAESENKKLLPGNLPVDYIITAVDLAGNSTTYTVSMRKIPDLKDPISDLDPDNLQPEDKGKIEDVIKDVDDILTNSPDITPEQKEELEQIKKDCEDMLDRLKPTDNGGGFGGGGTTGTTKPKPPITVKPYDPSTAPKGDNDVSSDPPPRDENATDHNMDHPQKGKGTIPSPKGSTQNAPALSEEIETEMLPLVPAVVKKPEAAPEENENPQIHRPGYEKPNHFGEVSFAVICCFLGISCTFLVVGWWLFLIFQRKKNGKGQ